MKVLIIDDSRLARKELDRLLREIPNTTVCAEAGNAVEAREAIQKHNPDLLLLDIQMPDESGFELLESLDKVPNVIFTTAYDQYAVQAFEKNAIDYLVKPIDPERLKSAIDRTLLRIGTQKSNSEEKMGLEDQVFVKDGDHCWFVKLKKIRFFETYGNYSWVNFDKQNVLIQKSLNYLETRLDNKKFFRANRQFIVNLSHIVDIYPWNNEAFRIEMSCGKEIDISRRRSNEFKKLMSF